tara:strand:+ start:301 stop:963 length:663 start_codon:yes stop_codon:yes gene_type:complete
MTMKLFKCLVIAVALATVAVAGTASLDAQDSAMSFFITSVGPGDGANLGGLSGADAHCQMLAEAAGSTKTWRAYLSQSEAGNQPAINARDRIGTGPWYNASGLEVAASVDDLHSANNELNKANSLSEKGQPINGRGDSPNMHDVLTGSQLDGTAYADGEDHTCSNWTSNSAGSAAVGHHDRQGGGDNPTSWHAAHASRGCSQDDLIGTGGNGLYYCFAID